LRERRCFGGSKGFSADATGEINQLLVMKLEALGPVFKTDRQLCAIVGDRDRGLAAQIDPGRSYIGQF
jgi:hypothetical protein